MSSTPGGALAALRIPEFRSLMAATMLLTCALLAQEVALGYELYRLTGNPLSLGLVGLAQVVPFVCVALFGGHVADRSDKRRVMLRALLAILCGTLALIWVTLPQTRERVPQALELGVIYGAMVLLGLARAFYTPANSSLRAFVVPRELLANASTWSATLWQTGAILGPALAGVSLAAFGVTGTLLATLALLTGALALLLRVQSRPPLPFDRAESVWQSLRGGLAFVWSTPIILYAITLDMVAVLCGGVLAILPVFASDVLAVGPEGLGLLRAAPALGALPTMLICAWWSPASRPWRNLLLAVIGFGVATLVFALSRQLWLSVAALVLTGIFDAVSVIVRQAVLQVLPPDHLRGRVLSVSSIFVSASNELGAFSSSVLVRLLGAVTGVLAGASLTLVSAAVMGRRGRALLGVRLQAPAPATPQGPAPVPPAA